MNNPTDRKSDTWRNFRHDLGRLIPDTWSNLREKPEVVFGILLLMVAGISLHWFATGMEECINEWFIRAPHQAAPALQQLATNGPSINQAIPAHPPAEPAPESVSVGRTLLFTAIAGALTFFSSLFAWAYRHAFRELQVRYKIVSSDRPRSCLVLFVSQQKLLKNPDTLSPIGPVTLPGANGDASIVLNGTDPLADADAAKAAKNPWWSWEMSLRGLAPHLPKLRRIYLIGSSDGAVSPGSPGTGTHRDLETMRRLLARYLVAAGRAPDSTAACEMFVLWQPVNFEDFDEVDSALNAIRREVQKMRGEDHDLCVDITSGQKPSSAAAAAFTLNKDVVLQYVQTNEPKTPHMHDVRLLTAPESTH